MDRDLRERAIVAYAVFTISPPLMAMWMKANGVAYRGNPAWALISTLSWISMGFLALTILGGLLFGVSELLGKALYKRLSSRRPDYFVRPDNVRKWIDWLKGNRNPVYWQLATFMILTGCRVGEAVGLMWDCVDLDMRLVRISRTVFWDHWTRRPILQNATKTEESTRSIVLPDILVELLRQKRERDGTEGPVFKDRDGELIKYNAIQSAFNAGFIALKLPWRSTHICRHTYATMALFATRDLSSVQASLGHKSRDITEKYAKAVALLSSGTAEKTASIFDLKLKDAGGNSGAIHAQNHVLALEKKEKP